MLDNELFNMDLLLPNKSTISKMKQVKSLNIYESSTTNFDHEGLFSVEIFGYVGSEERNSRFGYIDTIVPIMHPEIFKKIISLKVFYNNILSGKSFARWDDEEKDFVPDNIDTGNTGYDFFIKHYDKIVFSRTGSESRDYKIKLIDKSGRSKGLSNYILVEPAALRDYTIDKSGKPTEDEINAFYRKLLMYSNTLSNYNISNDNLELVDSIRYKIQLVFVELYDYIINLMNGKTKFIQSKWVKRSVRGGTRNVITSLSNKIHNLKDKKRIVSFNNTVIGLFQYLKALDQLTYHHVFNNFSHNIFTQGTHNAKLIDKDTLKTVSATIKTKTYDRWMSEDGLNSIINSFSQEEVRSLPIELEDKYYLCLIYDDGKHIAPVFNTDDFPEDRDAKYLRPITYAELFYISIAETIGKLPGLLTRYPIAKLGGIYPTIPYVKTTLSSRKVTLLDPGFTESMTLVEYPILKDRYYNSLSPHYTKLDRLGGDHDGDKVSFIIVQSEESIDEINKLMNSREFYITPEGKITYSVSTTDLDIVAKIMTR